jgi:steroid 5-alpha reductase family enzyme
VSIAGAAAVAWGLLLVLSTIVWLASLRARDASIADIWWGPALAVTAWTYVAILDQRAPRALLAAVLVTAWGLRLAVHIHARHRGEDPRYRAMRASAGEAFWWKSLFVVFWLQASIAWFVAMPLLMIARTPEPPAITVTDVAGVIVFCAGFAIEALADGQLRRFRLNPANRGRVLDTGLWRYSRHPNYFGDALAWWGIFLVAASTPLGWTVVASPALMTFLLVRVSGVALLERSLTDSKPGYAGYVRRTSAFIPWRRRATQVSSESATHGD